MGKLHPLAAAILAPLGLGSGLPGCGTTDGCPEVTSITEEIAGCTIAYDDEHVAAEACVDVALTAAGTCPADDAPELLTAAQEQHDLFSPRVACGPLRPPTPPVGATSASGTGGAPGDGAAGGGGGGAATAQGSCCYVFVSAGSVCIGGRPFLIGGQARVAPVVMRSDWTLTPEPSAAGARSHVRRGDLGEPEHRALAAAWLRDASYEHASVAAFARFALELLAVGAPPELVAAAHRAALDEIRHAQLCFALAARHGGEAVGPGPLALGDAKLSTTLRDVVVSVVREGCIGETVAALVATRALEGATDPAVRAALAIIAHDEAEHAALAWRFVAWAVSVGGDPIRAAAREVLAGGLAAESADGEEPGARQLDVMRAHGRLDEHELRAVAAEAMREVVGPCSAHVLEHSARIPHTGSRRQGASTTFA